MDIPRPAVPSERLDGWRETDATIEQAFSTPIVTVYTHTVVFEETTVRTEIRETTGYDHPWQFFFVSRIRLDPQRDPGTMLTKLVRRKAAAGFTDRLADRGIKQVTERDRREQPIGDAWLFPTVVLFGDRSRRPTAPPAQPMATMRTPAIPTTRPRCCHCRPPRWWRSGRPVATITSPAAGCLRGHLTAGHRLLSTRSASISIRRRPVSGLARLSMPVAERQHHRSSDDPLVGIERSIDVRRPVDQCGFISGGGSCQAYD